MKKLLLLTAFCGAMLVQFALVAQTYTFNGSINSNWSNANNWTPMGVPTTPLTAGTIVIAANSTQNINFTIGSGASLVINSGFTLTRTNSNLIIQGSMTNNGTLVNNRVLTISGSGTLTNNGTINNGNSAPDNINNSGTIENNGVINMIYGSINNQNTGIFNNNSTGSITISSIARIVNQNEFNNAGAITNNGLINAANGANDIFNNTGILINNLTITVGNNMGGTLLNAASGSVTNNSGSSLTINDNGFLINNGLLNNSGTVNNNNSISNVGTFNNNSGGILENGNSSGDIFDNTGTLNNNFGATINNFNGATINITNGTFVDNGTYNGAAPLPIELLSFTGSQQNSAIQLKWETATETNNAYMAVEASKDGIQFVEIGQRKGAGYSLEAHTYAFTDINPFTGINYYRLRQVDLDGKPTYHNIIAVKYEGKSVQGIKAVPTLVNTDFTLISESPMLAGSILQIVDIKGSMLQQLQIDADTDQKIVNVTVLPAGVYFLKVQTGNTIQSLRFVKL